MSLLTFIEHVDLLFQQIYPYKHIRCSFKLKKILLFKFFKFMSIQTLRFILFFWFFFCLSLFIQQRQNCLSLRHVIFHINIILFTLDPITKEQFYPSYSCINLFYNIYDWYSISKATHKPSNATNNCSLGT